jgi:hypothetical protein
MDNLPKPGYVSFATFRNALANFRAEGLPTRLDSSVLKNLSGSTQSQLKVTLRHLELIDNEDRVTSLFRELINSEEDVFKDILSRIIAKSYAFIFEDETGEFDLAMATPQQFSEKFRGTGLSGDTLRKAESFFINLATEAGITISKRITSGRTSADRPRKVDKRRISNSNTLRKPKTDGEIQKTPTASAIPKSEDVSTRWREKMLENLLGKFPEFSPDWDEESRQKWLDQFGNLMGMIRDEHGDDAE